MSFFQYFVVMWLTLILARLACTYSTFYMYVFFIFLSENVENLIKG